MGTPFFICQIAATKLYPCSPREEYFSYFTVACYRSTVALENNFAMSLIAALTVVASPVLFILKSVS